MLEGYIVFRKAALLPQLVMLPYLTKTHTNHIPCVTVPYINYVCTNLQPINEYKLHVHNGHHLVTEHVYLTPISVKWVCRFGCAIVKVVLWLHRFFWEMGIFWTAPMTYVSAVSHHQNDIGHKQ